MEEIIFKNFYSVWMRNTCNVFFKIPTENWPTRSQNKSLMHLGSPRVTQIMKKHKGKNHKRKKYWFFQFVYITTLIKITFTYFDVNIDLPLWSHHTHCTTWGCFHKRLSFFDQMVFEKIWNKNPDVKSWRRFFK